MLSVIFQGLSLQDAKGLHLVKYLLLGIFITMQEPCLKIPIN